MNEKQEYQYEVMESSEEYRGEKVSFDIKEHIGVVRTNRSGWIRELNLVSWNSAEPRYDLRDWAPDHSKMSRGITLSEDELNTVCSLFNDRKGK